MTSYLISHDIFLSKTCRCSIQINTAKPYTILDKQIYYNVTAFQFLILRNVTVSKCKACKIIVIDKDDVGNMKISDQFIFIPSSTLSFLTDRIKSKAFEESSLSFFKLWDLTPPWKLYLHRGWTTPGQLLLSPLFLPVF